MTVMFGTNIFEGYHDQADTRRYVNITNLRCSDISTKVSLSANTLVGAIEMNLLDPRTPTDDHIVSVSARYRLENGQPEVSDALMGALRDRHLLTDEHFGRIADVFARTTLDWIDASKTMEGTRFFDQNTGTSILVVAINETLG